MRTFTALLLLAGLALFGVVLHQTDLAEVWHHVRRLGLAEITIIILVYCGSFLADVASWLLTFPSAKVTLRWLRRLWLIQMFGNALNMVTPLASFGGEPVKAVLLNRHYGVGYREATATLVLAQTIGAIGLLIFLMTSFLLLLATAALPASYRLTAGIALTILAALVAVFFLMQRHRFVSRAGAWMGRGKFGDRAQHALQVIQDVEGHLIDFYLRNRMRFAMAVILALINWIFGAVEIYIMLAFLGHAVSFADAWMIEGGILLVRTALFFVPANIGTQEGTFLLVCGAITGAPALGIAAAFIRRFRELLWTFLGLAIGWRFSYRRRMADAPRP